MNMKKTSILFLLLSQILSYAQEPAMRNYFLQFASLDKPIEGLFYRGAGGEQQIVISNVGPTQIYNYRGFPGIVFYEKRKTEQGEVQIPVAMTELTTTLQNQVLAFSPAPEGSAQRYNIFVLDSRIASAPPESILFYNMTDKPIAGIIGDLKLQLKPGENQLLTITPPENSVVELQLVNFHQDTEDWRPIYSAMWPVGSRNKLIAIIVPDRNGKDVRFIVIRNIKTQEEVEAENEKSRA